jgi:tetratricopeptide (TPR) repeat protein
MKKNQTILRVLTACAVLSGVALLLWAVVVPIMDRREAADLVTEARLTLSPPLATMNDVEEVDCSRAESLLRDAIELAPSNGAANRELQLAQGCAALRRGDFVLAESSLRSASRRLRSDPRPHRWLGGLSLAQGDVAGARDHFERALEIEPRDIVSKLGLSDALAELGRLDEALELLAGDDVPSLALVELRRGIIYEELERVDDARAAYVRAMELAPAMAEAPNNLAALERDAGNLVEAWDHQSAALRISPNDPLMLLNAGLLAIVRGYDDEALRLLGRATELDRESADPARALADQLLVTGQVAQALEVLGPAVERFPRNAALQNTLGNALAAAGRVDEAHAAYRASIGIDQDLSEPHNGIAALLLAAGDLVGAEEELNRAARLDPANTSVRRNLAELYRRRGARDLSEREHRLAQALQGRHE